jgi:hypothetical protein
MEFLGDKRDGQPRLCTIIWEELGDLYLSGKLKRRCNEDKAKSGCQLSTIQEINLGYRWK